MRMYEPTRLRRWMLQHTQPEKLSLDHKAQDDIAWAADEIASLQSRLTEAEAKVERMEGHVMLPVTPTADLLEAIAVQRWPEDWEEGKRMQMEMGCGVVPPNAEMEMAAGTYKKIVEALKALEDEDGQ